MPHPVGNLINLAVEDDHFTIEAFKCAEAKVTVLQQNRRTDRARVNAFDKSSGGRDLIKRAHFSLASGGTQLRWHDDFALSNCACFTFAGERAGAASAVQATSA